MTVRQNLGALGEEAAAALLRKGGYRIVAQNHRCRRGEVDLVAERGELLVFVEVRTRATAAFGRPELGAFLCVASVHRLCVPTIG